MSKKMIITFEGIEGSGKSLHIENVAKHLKKKKINFINIREPGGSRNSEKIRKLILNNKSNFNKNTDLLLYLASRSENLEKIISKNYKKKVILIDRFTDSTIVYQGYGRDINESLIKNLNKFLINNLNPKLTFLLDIDPKVGLRRSKKRINNELRYENMPLSYHKKIRKAYLDIASKNKNRIKIIDASLDKDVISEIIWSFIQKELT